MVQRFILVRILGTRASLQRAGAGIECGLDPLLNWFLQSQSHWKLTCRPGAASDKIIEHWLSRGNCNQRCSIPMNVQRHRVRETDFQLQTKRLAYSGARNGSSTRSGRQCETSSLFENHTKG